MSLMQRGPSVPSACSAADLLAQPRHGAVEVMEAESPDAGDAVVAHPGRAIAIGARHEQPMQRRYEDGALDRELEGAPFQQIAEDGVDAEPFPDPAEHQRPADALGDERKAVLDALVERLDEQDLVAELRARRQQRGEPARRREFIGASHRGDDRLAHGAVDAFVLDDLHIGAFARLLEAKEHGAPSEHHRIRVEVTNQT